MANHMQSFGAVYPTSVWLFASRSILTLMPRSTWRDRHQSEDELHDPSTMAPLDQPVLFTSHLFS